MAKMQSAKQLCNDLINAANECGGVDNITVVVARFVDQPRGLVDRRVDVDGVGIGGHHVARVGRERLAQPALEAAQRLEEDRPAEELYVVRDVKVAVLVRQHQVALGDDADAPAVLVDDRDARKLVIAKRRHDVLDRHEVECGLPRRIRPGCARLQVCRSVRE